MCKGQFITKIALLGWKKFSPGLNQKKKKTSPDAEHNLANLY